jgi:uncharacterized protein YecE (DUF72 family)
MRNNIDSGILIGCAGWSLSAAVATAFPAAGSHLQRYAAVLPAVEINSSFYRPHRPATYARWRDSVPDDFRFSVKLPRTISHEQGLRDAEELLDRFMAEAGMLQHKLGCLLLQLPPSLRFVAADAETFFKLLRQRTDVAVACEPRHAGWFSTAAADLMQRYRIGFVHADPPPVRNTMPPAVSGIAYLRLHGSPEIYRSPYEQDFLAALAHRIEGLRKEAGQVWCVFDNTAAGHALPNALALMQLLHRP